MLTGAVIWFRRASVSDLRALDFVVKRFFMKLFTTNVMDTVKICHEYFNFDLSSSIMEKRRKTCSPFVLTAAIS